ncbi:hypothetical protein D3C80_1619490 [compost metagenome]
MNDRLETKSQLLVAGSDMRNNRNNRNNIRMRLTLPSEPVPHHLDTVSMFAGSSGSRHPADVVTAAFDTINTYPTLGDIPRLSCRTAIMHFMSNSNG